MHREFFNPSVVPSTAVCPDGGPKVRVEGNRRRSGLKGIEFMDTITQEITVCGLAGLYNLSSQRFLGDELLLQEMQKKISHRGPDASSVWLSNEHEIGLAFSRLKIVDLSINGMQPMFDPEKTIALCFNGEIYNHLALRQELELLGYRYRSQSDTETIIYAYKAWGINFVHKLEGMFVIALYDLINRRFYLIRDRIGVKPVYFSTSNNILSFASEIKALWALPWMSKNISQPALYHYLTFMVAPAPYTIFSGVYKLPAGYYLAIDHNKNISFTEWYDPVKQISQNNYNNFNFNNEQFCRENIRTLLLESTKKRMMSDVPIGAFLSGGLDSSLNVALMAQSIDRVKTFTVAFSDGPEHNELQWARKVAAQFGTEHHEIIISEQDAFDFYEQMVYHLDEPLSDCVCIPFYFVAKLAKESGVTVAQVGEGADELFFGYSTYARQKNFHARFWQPTQVLPSSIKKTLQTIVSPLVKNNPGRKEVIDNWATNKSLFWGGALAFNEQHKQVILGSNFTTQSFIHDDIISKIYPGMRQEYNSYSLVDYHLSILKERDPQADFCQQMLYLELKQRLPELLLMRADKMSMAVGVEAREPYLDHKLVEFMYQVPAHLKFKNSVTKYLLKKVAEEFLPRDIIYRQKVGFAAPTERWFAHGKYFPDYFAQKSSHVYTNNSSFTPSSQHINKLYDNNSSHFAVQNWTLQNIWTVLGEL